MTKRKQHRFKGGKIIDVEEYHDGRYGAPGCKREKKKNPTKEQIQKINAWNKARRCRGNYALGIKEQLIFPEIEYDKVDKVRGMDVIVVTTAETDEEARELLTQFGMPFKK